MRHPGALLRALLPIVGLVALAARAQTGVVIDADTGRAVASAVVVAGDLQRLTDERGRFDLTGSAHGASVSPRAIGYRRRGVDGTGAAPLTIALQPFRPKALYLSVYGIGSAVLREDALKLIDRTELNAQVIDIKGDRGIVPHRSLAVAAAGLGQDIVTVADMPALLDGLRERGLYLIARIVVFKDEPLVRRRPDWAVRDAQGEVWKDREGLAWIDPFRRDAWEHSLALAEEAARLGFDEVQFDYVRFPDAAGLVFAQANTESHRVAAIGGFLEAARERLRRYNVFLAVDIFGYVAWNANDTFIGQRLEAIAEQALRDYAFDRREFRAAEIRAQIDAAEAAGSDGWMLWNPQNRYVDDGLAPTPRSPRP